MTLPYQVEFRGFPACPCLATWLPAYEAELNRRGILTGPLHIYQLIGGAAASGGTHASGGAFDLLDLPGDQDQWLARQMGADATWARPYNWDGRNGIAHTHRVLTGCPHNGPARYQITAVQDGFNGLGTGGRGAPDDGPRPLSGRTWRQGIQWAKAQAEEDDVQLNDKLYPDQDNSPTVGQVLRRMDRFITRQDQRSKVILEQIDALPAGATKAEIRRVVAQELSKDDSGT